MAKRAIKRLMAKNGSTYAGKDGQQKNGYTRCGVLMKDEQTGDISIKIEALPINFDGWLNAWEMEGAQIANASGLTQKPVQQQYQPQQSPSAPAQTGYAAGAPVNDMNQEIPF